MSFLQRTLSLLLVAAAVVNATHAMQRPPNFKVPAQKTGPVANIQPTQIQKRGGGQVQIGYFTNWGIYTGFNFQPTDIVSAPLTHIYYAFAIPSADTGAITMSDSFADEQKHYTGDSWNDSGNNLYGNLKQLYLLKLKQRNLKVILSIGGYTYSLGGDFNFVTDATKRAKFVADAVTLIEDYGFDGIDIDFEFPDAKSAQGFADLNTEVRAALDDLKTKKGDTEPYYLSVAVSAGADNYASLVVPQIDKALSFWNLMAYDYSGSWLNYTDNQANLYNGERTNVSTDKALKWYTDNGATASKITMGIPLYGRAFEKTAGLGASYNGIGAGTVAPGIYSYKALPLAGAQVFENATDVSSYSYDSSTQEFVSYDTPNIVKTKAQYVIDKGLAGTMFWDLATDKTGDDSLVNSAAGVYSSLDQTQNHISYPNSKWDNIKNNMGQSA